MKKNLLKKIGLFAVMGSMFLAAACGNSQEDSVGVSGSTSVSPYMEKLAAAYMDKTNKDIEVGGGGSSTGISNVTKGISDIGMSSRNLTEDEKAALAYYEIAMDGLAIIVHKDNPVSNLGVEQIRDIYAEKITNWSEVGGNDGKISLVARENGSGTRDAFEELVMGGKDGDGIAPSATIQNNNGAIRTIVAGNENAIGFVSLGATIGDTTIKPLNIDNVAPSAETIKSKEYGLFRVFYIVTAKSDVSKETSDFIDYILSDGQAVLEKEGLVRIN